MRSVLTTLNRYKFTLIYSVVFYLLGGLVLAGPAFVGGLVVDWLMAREYFKGEPYEHVKYYVISLFLLMLMYQPSVMGSVSSQADDRGVLEFLLWAKPFVDQMANYVPIIDRYGEQAAEISYIAQLQVRHVLAVYWFYNALIISVIIGGTVNCINLLKQNNYYLNCDLSVVPKYLRPVFEDLYIDPDDILTAQRTKYDALANRLMYVVSPIVVLLALGASYLSFWGFPEIERSFYRQLLYIPLFLMCLWMMPPMLFCYGIAIRRHCRDVTQKRKLLET